MLLAEWKSNMLLILLLCSSGSDLAGSYVGINIGTQTSNLPPAADIVSILRTQQIKHVRLFDADHRMLHALANTGIEVVVGVPNDQVLQIGNSQSQAADWINKNVAPFVPATRIAYIAVGDEILTTFSNANATQVLVPAMQFLHSALLAANLNFQVKISSPQSMDMIPKHFPPSTATFNSSWNSVMEQLLRFLKTTGASFMLNAQPYYGYTEGEGVFPLEYALFQPLKQSSQMVDPDTDLHYLNMFDAMVDAAYYSMQSLNFSGISVMVTSSGWPSLGGATEPDANIDNALAYNSMLIGRALNGSGTPSRSNSSVSIYLHELFSEDLLPGPVSAKNWGVFASNGTALYPLNFGHLVKSSSNSTGLVGIFCVANSRANSDDLKKGLDWACGPGSANCTAIQPGQPCYQANNLEALASYAYNDYYHRTQANGGTCIFGNTAMVTTTDPSHGSCIFAGRSGSSSSSNTSGGSTTSSAFGPGDASSQASKLQEVSTILIVATLLHFLVVYM
ncbi:glucan endo-1,3-beta-glucosidase 4-like isoform X2 [Zingiber officinale]|uniref:glucan endo-1,3-beta-D-glucosidase n=3 Tax=Zingiber officinale TaxID=94328 RepID=A0A8J5HCU1_ZINOF|nr:glucan endo-1,3-beta-glucosidase 4-like isoform X2 [Zingiber officinale]KAG6525085.1 hypothetical protein ZIOFF_015037 [Zingiber officinale]